MPKQTIIVVQDEQDVAEMCAEMIRVNGFHILKTSGSALAISLIDKEEPVAGILDIRMTDISSLDVLQYICNEPKLANIPVMVASEKSMPVDTITNLEAGTSLHLSTPLGYLDLRHAVEKALAA